MTRTLNTAYGPCIERTFSRGAATFVCREYPMHVAAHLSVFENRAPVRMQSRAATGRFGKAVLA
jgi:hypothetical protein